MAEFSSQSMVFGKRDSAGGAYVSQHGMYANSELEIKVFSAPHTCHTAACMRHPPYPPEKPQT